ncbi:MAG: methionyl-tRNA formyltransferase [Pseudomonadota bacterium]|jgi:methionyl-tRNA formyltransferase|nr:methionyl-tRNA formyltransferase [Alphaproteobacteria bacterium]
MTKIIFMGTPEFALIPLQTLVDAKYNVVAVYTQPPRPKGRGHAETKSPVHQFALEKNIPVHTPTTLKSTEEQEKFSKLDADLAIVAAYGLLLPKQILEAPKLGCINIHASLLPRWRGAAPIHRAIEAGDNQTGITMMQMDEGLDTGPMLYSQTIPINSNDTGQTLHDKMLSLSAQVLLECLPSILANQLRPTPQPTEGVTYAHKLKKAESNLDFSDEAIAIINKIRAFTPWPGTTAPLDNQPIKILDADPITNSSDYPPGTWIVTNDHRLLISCKTGAIQLKMLQRPGSKPISSNDFLNGYRGENIIFEK